jgi:hypothetical protein
MNMTKPYWSIRDPKERAAAKADQEKLVRGPARLRREGHTWIGLRAIKFTDEASERYAKVFCMVPTSPPPGFKPVIVNEVLYLSYGTRRYSVPHNPSPRMLVKFIESLRDLFRSERNPRDTND